MKFDPPKFEGTSNVDVYLKWIQTLKSFFDIKGYSNEKAFNIAVLKLKKYASLWHESTKRQRATEGKSCIRTWSKLKKLMRKRFLPNYYKHDYCLIVASLSQGCMSMEEYSREFKQVQIQSGLERNQSHHG